MSDYTGNWIDRQIQRAIDRGEFDNLPGAGKPLDLSDVDDPDWWVRRLIRREGLDLSAAMPAVLSLRREHDGFPTSLADIADEDDVREVLKDYNRRVAEDRLKPSLGRGIPVVAPLVDIEQMVDQWRRLRPG